MSHDKEFRTTEEKVQNIEHYLVRKVDAIQRLVQVAVGLSAVAAVVAIWGVADRERVITIAEGTRSPGHEAPADLAAALGTEDGDRPADAAPAPPAERTAPPQEPAPGPKTEPAQNPAAQTPAAQTPAASPEKGAPETGRLAVEESAIADEIVGLSPEGAANRFPGSQSRVFCWSRIVTPDFDAVPAGERVVTHRWVHEETVVKERRVTVGSSSYRVYTMAEVGERPGRWRVEIVDARGRIIGTERFVVG